MEQKWLNKLTNEELELISSTYYPLLKKGAMEKIQRQFVELGEQLQQISMPEVMGKVNGFKISKGENYQDLPYMVLDYPKISGEGFVLLCRVVFWWGKYIGVQFFLNQKYFQINNLIDDANVYVLINSNIWNNDISHEDYKLLSNMGEEEKDQLLMLPYLKIIKVISIKKPDHLFEEVIGFYQHLLSLPELTAKQSS